MKIMEENIFVFKTNIQNAEQATRLKALNDVKEITSWSTDLEDCDNILRIVGRDTESKKIIQIINQLGFYCEELTYS